MILFGLFISGLILFVVLYTKIATNFIEKVVIAIISAIAVLFDLLVELNGTLYQAWNYPTSISFFMLFNRVPIELPFLFAIYGCIIAIIAIENVHLTNSPNIIKHKQFTPNIFLLLTIVGLIIYFLRLWRLNALVIAIPFSIYGYKLVRPSKKALIISAGLGILDFILEMAIVIFDYYQYSQEITFNIIGLPIYLPFEYFLFSLGGISIISYILSFMHQNIPISSQSTYN